MNTQAQTAIAPAKSAQHTNSHKRIQAAQVCELCGGVSTMSIWRWLNDPEMNFPKPIYIGRRRYWRETDITDWLESREREVTS